MWTRRNLVIVLLVFVGYNCYAQTNALLIHLRFKRVLAVAMISHIALVGVALLVTSSTTDKLPDAKGSRENGVKNVSPHHGVSDTSIYSQAPEVFLHYNLGSVQRKKRGTKFASGASKSFFGMRGKRKQTANTLKYYLKKRVPSPDDMAQSFFGMRGKRPLNDYNARLRFNLRGRRRANPNSNNFFAMRGKRMSQGLYATRGKKSSDADIRDVELLLRLVNVTLPEYIRAYNKMTHMARFLSKFPAYN